MDLSTVIRITGVTNFVFLLLAVGSCRCMGFHRLTKKLFDRPWFLAFYNKHCWYWYALYISVIVHLIAGFYVFGPPWRL